MRMIADKLLSDAEQTTGLSDWGGEEYYESSFRTLYSAMVESVQTDAQLHEQGLRGAEMRLRAMAEARLQFIEDRKEWPAITKEVIQRPVFILGFPRSGSSFLLSLLSQDPANRSPKVWEMMFPSPPPEPPDYSGNERITRAERIYEAMGLMCPEVAALHPTGARLEDECHLMMELMALGDNLPALWRLSGYNKVRATVDLRQGYELHRMVLQNLQYRNRGKRWVIKNPGHVFYLSHLLAVYPDACVIQTHRDPAKVIPSVAALLAAMRRANSDAPLRETSIARGNLKAFAAGLERAIEFRRQPGMEPHFHDVHFRELTTDPLGTVRGIYKRFGITLTDDAATRMEHWLATDDSHPAKLRFTLGQFDLDEKQIDEAYGNYIAHYGIALER